MAWKLDNPFYSLADEQEQQRTMKEWESERLGGLMVGNARIPLPITFLIALIILTAFLITMPIWGQRPNAELIKLYVDHLNDPAVLNAATPEEKMKVLFNAALADAPSHPDPRMKNQVIRHPFTWDDIQALTPQFIELQAKTTHLADYTILGDRIVLANFEGNYREDGTRERTQPWWDKGYTIDVFYVSYFLLWMFFMVKRLPHFSKQPNYASAK